MLKTVVLMIMALLLTFPAVAQEVSKEQLKGLDEQVQEIKSDVLGIEVELSLLEEQLLYPSGSQIAVFVSVAEGETFRLDAVEIELSGRPATHHLYTFKELEALRRGGVQRIYTGNLRTGEHDFLVTAIGKSGGGADFRQTQSFRILKDVGPKIVEVTLAGREILMKDW